MVMQAKVMAAEDVRRDLRHVIDDVIAGQDVVVERYAKKVVKIFLEAPSPEEDFYDQYNQD